jgi:hypothetical protein
VFNSKILKIMFDGPSGRIWLEPVILSKPGRIKLLRSQHNILTIALSSKFISSLQFRNRYSMDCHIQRLIAKWAIALEYDSQKQFEGMEGGKAFTGRSAVSSHG